MLPFTRLTALLLVAMLAMAACGASEPQIDVVAEAAAVTEASLQLTSDLDTTELVDVRSGEAASLNDIVTGDRPVLLWYWAPN